MIVHGATVANAGRWATDPFSCKSRQGIELNWAATTFAHACRPTKARGRVPVPAERVRQRPSTRSWKLAIRSERRRADAKRPVTPDSTADVSERGSYPVGREIFPHGFPHGTLGG